MTTPRRANHYGRYEGGPDPLAPPAQLGEALRAIGDEVMTGTSAERALKELQRRGLGARPGLDDLAGRAARRRQELLAENSLGGTIARADELLQEALLAERQSLVREVGEGARFAEMELDMLPRSTAASITKLLDYSWRSKDAEASFEAITDLLGAELMDQHFKGMKEALEGATEEDKADAHRMLADLNALLLSHRMGEDTTEQFRDFMTSHGRHFPERPASVEELLDLIATRSAAAARMRNSMTPQQRAELDALSAHAFGSPELKSELNDLTDNVRALRPDEDWDSSEDFGAGTPIGLGHGSTVLQDVAALDVLAEQLSQQYDGADLSDIDLDALAEQLGPEAVVAVETMREVEKALRREGLLRRGSDGEVRLSPKAIRQLGTSLLRDAAARLSGKLGARDASQSGAAGERTGSSRSWEFGDSEPWNVPRTILNAQLRAAIQGHSAQVASEDIEVEETESRTQAAVVLLVDTSFSMVLEGRWLPMKRTALALHHLVATRFRGDDLLLVGFSRYAQELAIDELTELEGTFQQGTNLHHALLLANQHFRRHNKAQPVLLIVTDGEPTAHLEPGGDAFFDYPPHPMSLARTVSVLDESVRLSAQVTFFRLGDDPGLAHFVDSMARRSRGRVVVPEADDLDTEVLQGFLRSRRTGPFQGG